MATAGQIITNNVNGERLKYLQTASNTNGKRTQFELWVSPKGFMPIRHIHPRQTEQSKSYQEYLKLNVTIKSNTSNQVNYLPLIRVNQINGGMNLIR